MKAFRAIFLTISMSLTYGTAEAHAQNNSSQRVWTVSEILAERGDPVVNDSPRMCMGGRFKPCVCAGDVSKLVQYRPAIAQCGKRAGIVLSGKYINAFSVVVRDRENRDRWPLEFPVTGRGYGGCNLSQAKAGLAKCSAYKVQKIISVSNPNGSAKVHCLGQSGYAPLLKGISRITIKLADVPGTNTDPLERLCLKNATTPLN
jgi:hypothetical protein